MRCDEDVMKILNEEEGECADEQRTPLHMDQDYPALEPAS